MKILFKNKRKYSKKNQKIIELFGLSNAGKTTFLKELFTKGKRTLMVEKGNSLMKSFYLIKYLLKHPFKSTYLFYIMNTNWIRLNNLTKKEYFKIFIMRNSYLSAVFSKYEYLRREKGEIFVDEFLLEALFMIFQEKSSEEEVYNVVKKLVFSDEILMVEVDKETRHERLKKRTPGEDINKEYSLKWVENSEYNNEIFKKVIINWFSEQKNMPY